jgi:L-ascorbate metabolism protein UlaG (beta-lactamase superfamily)
MGIHAKILTGAICCGLIATSSLAHDHGAKSASAHYIANEGVLVVDGDTKIMFDPLFHNSYGQYRLPSEKDRAAMMAGAPPFDGVDIVFISHAHGDHFDAEDMNAYLAANNAALLIAPAQAVEQMRSAENWDEALANRTKATRLGFGDAPVEMKIGGVAISAVRIPHAGWPRRAEVENLVYRVTLSPDATVMHMGDADPNDDHYAPYEDHWAARDTDMGFPPYWFFGSAENHAILKDRLRIKHSVGVHVPEITPPGLEAAREKYGIDFFAVPGETRYIGETEKN